MDLAVVIITKNLEWNIERVLDSVREHCPEAGQVVVVDSASTDRTVDLALAWPHPVSVVRLDADQQLSAAAGRWVGHQVTDSEFILFVDGDMELVPGFCEAALAVMRSDPRIGAVGGRHINVPRGETPEWARASVRTSDAARDASFVSGGAGLYRRTALDEVGSFAIDVISDEEPALGVRLRHAGYRLVRLDRTTSFHHTDPADRIGTILKRRRRNLWLGHGQNIRFFAGTGMLGTYLRERGHGIVPGLYLLGLLASVILTLATGQVWWVIGAVALLPIAWAIVALRRRDPYGALYSLVIRFAILEGTIRGLMRRPMDPSEYHLRYEVLR